MTEKIAIKEVQGLEQPSGLVTLYEIEIDNAGSKAFLAPQLDSDLSAIQLYDFDNNSTLRTYTAIPIQEEQFEVKSRGPSARPVVTFSNVTTDFLGAIGNQSYQNLVGKKFFRRRTLAKYLKDGSADPGSGNTPIEFPRQTWIIDRVEQESALEISFELASPFATEGLTLPYRVVGHNACPWQYQGASPTKSETNRRGGCTWHEENKYRISVGGTSTIYTVHVNQDDEYIVPSTTSFTTYTSGTKAANSYHKNTTTLGTASGVRRFNKDGEIDTSADGSTVTNFWQAVRSTSAAPSDSSADWQRVRVHTTYSNSTTYFAYTDDRFNDYVIPSSGTIQVWQTKQTHVGNSPGFGLFWQRGDLCGKRLSSCQCRFGFSPISVGTATSTGKATKDTKYYLPFGGFPGARKFK